LHDRKVPKKLQEAVHLYDESFFHDHGYSPNKIFYGNQWNSFVDEIQEYSDNRLRREKYIPPPKGWRFPTPATLEPKIRKKPATKKKLLSTTSNQNQPIIVPDGSSIATVNGVESVITPIPSQHPTRSTKRTITDTPYPKTSADKNKISKPVIKKKINKTLPDTRIRKNQLNPKKAPKKKATKK